MSWSVNKDPTEIFRRLINWPRRESTNGKIMFRKGMETWRASVSLAYAHRPFQPCNDIIYFGDGISALTVVNYGVFAPFWMSSYDDNLCSPIASGALT